MTGIPSVGLASIDPTDSPKAAIAGRVVTMSETNRVIDEGVVYLEKGNIVDVKRAEDKPPADFEDIEPAQTGGTIYPGLIELHNHLAYNALRLWKVPKQYSNRDQWGGIDEYQRNISFPMNVIGKSTQKNLLPALIRYVECKCLVGGVTTSQGIELFSNHGARRFYRGIVRNVENTEDPLLPDALAKIADIEAASIEKFAARLAKQTCFLLHLAEGKDETARKHFLALKRHNGSWAIGKQLAGIHAAGLTADDLKIYAKNGGAIIWSPLSNLLLYGGTALVEKAKELGIRIGLGSDWSPSGSKNLLGELKVARLVSDSLGDVFTDAEIVAMATRNAASILQWQDVAGSVERGKRADLLVIAGADKKPYAQLIEAREKDISFVMISGVARYGTRVLVNKLTDNELESVTIGDAKRVLNLAQPDGDPVVGGISLEEATAILTKALHDLPKLAKHLKKPPTAAADTTHGAGFEPVEWSIALDEIQPTGMDIRTRLPYGEGIEGPDPRVLAGFDPSSVTALELDPLTVADDPRFLDLIEEQINLPDDVRTKLRGLYD